MPRGNLESISPRALVLAAIAAALDSQDYAEAWRLTSVNRVSRVNQLGGRNDAATGQ